MRARSLRIIAAALAALLPACGDGGQGAGGGTGNPAFPVTMTEPKGGQTFTAPATISLSAIAVDPANVAKLEFVVGARRDQGSNTWSGGAVVATLTQPPFQSTWADVPGGIHTLVAFATDRLGAQTSSNTVTINVLSAGESPGGWMPIAKVGNSPPSTMWFVDANQGWVAADARILHTVDGGATWLPQWDGTSLDVAFGISGIQFVDAERGWAVGHGAGIGIILRTTDGGATWIPSSSPPPGRHLGNLWFVDVEVGWITSLNELFATKDGGVTWTALPSIPNLSILSLRFVDRQSGWALGTVLTTKGEGSSGILHTTDGGQTWTEQLRTESANESFSAVEFVSTTTAWVIRRGVLLENNGILFTTDGGATWIEQTYPFPATSGGISALDFVSPTQGWGVGDFGTIIHTENGGQSWVLQQTGATDPSFVDVRFVDANVGWALRGDGLLFKTTTGGKAS